MKMIDPILTELEQEAKATRRVLERVPTDRLDWRPHPKSRTIGELANHVAVAQARIAAALQTPIFEMGQRPATVPDSTEGILAVFDASTAEAKKSLEGFSDEDLLAVWEGQMRGKTIMKGPRAVIIRNVILNHIYHHRGQLTIYLRLLDIPVPAVYGPSADENPFA